MTLEALKRCIDEPLARRSRASVGAVDAMVFHLSGSVLSNMKELPCCTEVVSNIINLSSAHFILRKSCQFIKPLSNHDASLIWNVPVTCFRDDQQKLVGACHSPLTDFYLARTPPIGGPSRHFRCSLDTPADLSLVDWADLSPGLIRTDMSFL